MSNSRVQIFRVAVDAAGDPDVIQLPEGAGVFSKITVSILSAVLPWTLYAPFASSLSKSFSAGSQYVFESGPYQGGDVLGYIATASGSSFAILFCER